MRNVHFDVITMFIYQSKLISKSSGLKFLQKKKKVNLYLIGNEATATETARTGDAVHPLEPFRVQVTVGLFVLWFEHSNALLQQFLIDPNIR